MGRAQGKGAGQGAGQGAGRAQGRGRACAQPSRGSAHRHVPQAPLRGRRGREAGALALSPATCPPFTQLTYILVLCVPGPLLRQVGTLNLQEKRRKSLTRRPDGLWAVESQKREKRALRKSQTVFGRNVYFRNDPGKCQRRPGRPLWVDVLRPCPQEVGRGRSTCK